MRCHILRLPICIGLIYLLNACSGQQVYDFGSDLGRGIADCEARLTADERRECEAGRDLSYQDYQRERALVED